MARPASRRPRARRPAPIPAPDRHVLYERAVQNAPYELDFVERMLRRHGRPARRLREDFSGTALLSAEWVGRGPDREATAVDLEPSVHAWARAHRVPGLGDAAARLALVTGDVRDRNGGGFDAVVALNFSYSVFKTRDALRGYLAAALDGLAPGGVLVMDAFGGWEAQKRLVEKRRLRGGVVYRWEQESFDPISNHIRCAIHFDLPGRRRLRRAFTYDWRLWSLPELRELLAEAGFEAIEVLWDVAKGQATRYVPRRTAANHAGWLAYVVARRPGG
jgi:SAM-dependent methyltransferase